MPTVTEWTKIKEEARNAAVDVHYARERFLASKNDETRMALLEARDAWTDKVLAFQVAVTDGLVLSVEPDELQDPEAEDLLDGDPPADGKSVGTEKTEGDKPSS